MTDKNVYGIPYIEFDNFDDIKFGKYHYNYKTIDFMLNYKENSEKLLIIFHGSIRKEDILPMFLKYNYEKDNISLLSISDKLLELNYKKSTMFTRSACFSETNKYNFHEIYIDVMNNIINIVKAKKNIFIGPCIGAKPAIYFGSIFKSNILILNGWIYPTEEMKQNFEKSANLEQNSSINYDIEKKIIESPPNHIKIYINKQDKWVFDMNLQFINFCKKHIPDKIDVTVFDYNNPKKFDAHMTFFPEGENFDSVVSAL